MRIGLRRVAVPVPSAEIELALTDQLVGVEVLGDTPQLLVVGPAPDASPRVTSRYRAVHLPVGVANEVADTMSVEVAGTYLQEGYRLTALCVLGRVQAIARPALPIDTADLASAVVTEPLRAPREATAAKVKKKRARWQKSEGPTLKDRIADILEMNPAQRHTLRDLAVAVSTNNGVMGLMMKQLVGSGRARVHDDGTVSAATDVTVHATATEPPASGEFQSDEL